MRLLCLLTLFAALLLLPVLAVAPIRAQPTPPDVVENAAQVLEVATEGAQSLGVAAFVAVVVSLVVLVIVVGGVVLVALFVWKGGLRPIWDLVDKANKRADEERDAREVSEKKLTEYRERQATAELTKAQAAERQAAASERLTDHMAKLETGDEAKAERKSAVKAVNEHTDVALKPIAAQLGQIIEKLTSNEQSLAARDEALNSTVAAATLELVEVKKAVERITDTGELSPDAVPDTPPES